MSIKHLQDLPARQFLNVIQRFDEFTITEKVDGAALVVGVDNDGKLYTSRSNKGQDKRHYYEYQYSQTPANAPFINAHRYLAENLGLIPRGYAFEVEVLFGRQPNAIVYGTNRVVFLRPVIGDAGEISQPHTDLLINAVKRKMERSWDNVLCIGFQSHDGKTIEDDSANRPWVLGLAPTVDHRIFNDHDEKTINKLTEWLSWDDVGGWTNEELINVNLSQIPKTDRPVLKRLREDTQAEANRMKATITERYINVLRTMTSMLCDCKLKDGEDIGIEGVVFLDPNTQEQFKIVNKREFTTINAFNHLVRNSIRKTSYGKIHDTVARSGILHSLAEEQSIYDGFLSSLNNQLWTDDAGLHAGMVIKHKLRQHQGESHTETVDNITEWLTRKNQHVVTFRGNVVHHCNVHLKLLDERRQLYMDKVSGLSVVLDDGRWLGYTKEIHNRTLLMFADLEIELKNIRDVATFARDKKVIVESIFRKQLAGL